MEIINPRITIENTDSFFWLVRMEQQLSDVEHLDIRLKVARDPAIGLVQVQKQLLTQLQETVSRMLSKLP